MPCCAVLCAGWAAADALLMRTFPILSGAWMPRFDLGHVISAVQANVFIVSSTTTAAAAVAAECGLALAAHHAEVQARTCTCGSSKVTHRQRQDTCRTLGGLHGADDSSALPLLSAIVGRCTCCLWRLWGYCSERLLRALWGLVGECTVVQVW